MGWGILGGEDVEFRSGNATLQAHIGRPAAPGRYPAIITLHGINGPSAGTHRAAERYGEHHPWLRAGIAMHGFPFYPQGLNEKKPQHAYDLADRIQAPVLILHGAADDRAPVADVYRMAQRLEQLGKTFVLTVYSGTGHAFTLPDGGAYNPAAAANAWDQSIAFLDRYLRA
jgi:dienelactone hydrolase